MDETGVEETVQKTYTPIVQNGTSRWPSSSCCDTGTLETNERQMISKVLNVDLLVIDLATCKRCVPTGDQLRSAVHLLGPVADALGIELRHHEIVAQTPAETKEHALVSSPTIRLNGRDIAQDIRESECESCGELTSNNTSVDCREWHYRGKIYPAAPLTLLIETITGAMLNIDEMAPIVPSPLEELPENLERYFDNKKSYKGGSMFGVTEKAGAMIKNLLEKQKEPHAVRILAQDG